MKATIEKYSDFRMLKKAERAANKVRKPAASDGQTPDLMWTFLEQFSGKEGDKRRIHPSQNHERYIGTSAASNPTKFDSTIVTFFYKSRKPAFVLFLLIQLFSTAVKGQSVNARKDIRIRAGATSDALYGERNFAEEAMEKVAVVYLTDSFFSYAKTGVTVFGNERELHPVPAAFTRFADSVVRQKFGALTMARFEVLNPDSLNMPDQLEALETFKMKITEGAKPFIDSLYKKGFDGLLILEEKERTPNKIQYDQACQHFGAKGFYQYWNKRFIYHAVDVKVYDLETRERLKYLGFVQFSAEKYPFDKKAPLLPLEPYMEALKTRFVNNIDNIIAEHKMH